MRLVFFQPDIAANVGAAIRTCACFGVDLHLIEPLGFALTTKDLRRAAMDYGTPDALTRHVSYEAFIEHHRQTDPSSRLILMTTKGASSLWQTRFRSNDWLIMGRESSGAPDYLHERADARLFIPMKNGARSLNVSVAAGVALAEASRQFAGATLPLA